MDKVSSGRPEQQVFWVPDCHFSSPTDLVILIENPSDELRMRLDDFLSNETDGQSEGWGYLHQPERDIDPANVERHLIEEKRMP